jgi:hypothetical protein
MGWKYILQEYPEVRPCTLSSHTQRILTSIFAHRLTKTAQWLLVVVMAGMQSSAWHFESFWSSCVLILALRSWIQGNPELGFGFKALVCINGVRFPSLHEGANEHTDPFT